MKTENLKSVGKTLLSSFAISFSLLCAAPVLVFLVLTRANEPEAIEKFVAALTFGTHRQEKTAA